MNAYMLAVQEAGDSHSEHSTDTEQALPCTSVPLVPCRCTRHCAPSRQGEL